MNLTAAIVGTITIYLSCLVAGYVWAKVVGGDGDE